jgi:hypothetical protein
MACMGKDRNEHSRLVENLTERDRSEDQAMYGRIILKVNFKKQDQRVWTGFIWFKIGSSGGLV